MPDPAAIGSAWGSGQIAAAQRAADADRIVGKVIPPTFEAIAGALRRQANDLVQAAQQTEEMGGRLQLAHADVDFRVRGLRAEAVLVGEAYRVMAALAPLEFSVRAMIKAA